MSSQLKSIFTVSLGTFSSRVFGLLRDVAMAAFLGVSAASNAFIFAFTVPNLFRRLLGEGALTSAFVPVLSQIVGQGDPQGAYRFVNRVLSRLLVTTVILALVLGALYAAGYVYLNSLPLQPLDPIAIAAGDAASGAVTGAAAGDVASGAVLAADAASGAVDAAAATAEGGRWLTNAMVEQWTTGMVLGLLLLPYLPMVCLAAILSAALNVNGHFAVPAVSPLLLNLCMIAALVVGGTLLMLGQTDMAVLLCIGVLAGGVLQLLAPAVALYRHGWRPRLDFAAAEHMHLLWKLFVPGVLGAAALQINVLVSRVLAFGLNETATTTLNYVNRLIELPLGLFAVAIATVIFPQMSLHLARGNADAYRDSFGQGLRLTLAVTLPAAVGLIALASPILTLLFRWGRFSAEDVSLMVPLLAVTALSIPFYAVSAFLTRAYHARQDTSTPARIAVVVLIVNLALCLALMGRYEATGLAAANTLAAVVQVALMGWGLRRQKLGYGSAALWKALLQSLGACAVMALAVVFGDWLTERSVADEKLAALLACAIVIPLGGLVYGGLLWAMGFEDRHAIVAIFRKRSRAAR